MPANQLMQSATWRQVRTYLYMTLCAALLAACGSVPQAPSETGAQKRASTASKSKKSSLPPAGSGRGGYYLDDGPGDDEPDDLLAIPDAEPKIEPYSSRGNRTYEVFGKSYTPFLDERPFRQRGRGSWYGRKFHGQRTSSGEPYDMYKMTAAHPTLPIPSYARVTNLANGKQVIVRVNDRGPFHSNRIMDLSYTAALKLGYVQQGSAELEVERILPAEIERMAAGRQSSGDQASAAAATPSVEQPVAKPEVSVLAVPVATASGEASNAGVPVMGGVYLQLGAYSQAGSAETARSRLQQQWAGTLPPIEVVPGGAVYRLFSGPFASRDEAANVAQKLKDGGTSKPLIVQR
ncbi:rare lipoprotein A [Paucimonas lemoignei]|uniref:Endolytic peptidoglycan transglycosylase RlpA n=1 Tax=Paucimonas lemoignei TaxID=29443 RepID=A0A4R3I1X1_PAULE|nr:septal ring lytic transglycosylase RlpA family protein [Paucimonas lemoignei]TCS37869.1 rare lipoprotein A [Paucimonas lemoignei]